jgi:hypothetical protein
LYGVPLIFGELLKPLVDDDDKRRVYKAVAEELLTIRNNTLAVDTIASGAVHAILAGDRITPAFRLALMIHIAVRQRLPPNQLTALLEQTALVRSILSSTECTPTDAYARSSMHLGVASAYLQLEEYDKAEDALRSGIADAEHVGLLSDELRGFRTGLVVTLGVSVAARGSSGRSTDLGKYRRAGLGLGTGRDA